MGIAPNPLGDFREVLHTEAVLSEFEDTRSAAKTPHFAALWPLRLSTFESSNGVAGAPASNPRMANKAIGSVACEIRSHSNRHQAPSASPHGSRSAEGPAIHPLSKGVVGPGEHFDLIHSNCRSPQFARIALRTTRDPHDGWLPDSSIVPYPIFFFPKHRTQSLEGAAFQREQCAAC